jgi:hypothetical protein
MGSYTLTRSDGCTVNGTLVDGKVDGAVIVTFPNGRQESVKYYSMNIPVGTHTTWDEEGNVLSTIEYRDGEVIAVDGQPMPPPNPPPGNE